jgi:hypothetical protein
LKIPKGGNQNPYIGEEQTPKWPKEKGQKDKQRSTRHTTNDLNISFVEGKAVKSFEFEFIW